MCNLGREVLPGLRKKPQLTWVDWIFGVEHGADARCLSLGAHLQKHIRKEGHMKAQVLSEFWTLWHPCFSLC